MDVLQKTGQYFKIDLLSPAVGYSNYQRGFEGKSL